MNTTASTMRSLLPAAMLALALMPSQAAAGYTSPLSAVLRELQVTEDSLARCQHANGLPIERRQCARWAESVARIKREDAQEAARQRYAAEAIAQAEARAQADREAAAERQAQVARTRDERAAAFAQEQAARDAEMKAAEAREAAADEAKRKRCGRDYMNPAVGMRIERVRQCVAEVQLTGQINRRDGVVSTYEAEGGYFHVMGGRVIAWGQY